MAIAVPPGNYTVRVAAPGFVTRSISEVLVHIARQTSLPAITLDLGVLEQSVEVLHIRSELIPRMPK